MILITCPLAIVRAEPRSVAPEDESRVAVVRGQRAEDVAALEVGDLDEAVLHRQRVVALNLCTSKSKFN